MCHNGITMKIGFVLLLLTFLNLNQVSGQQPDLTGSYYHFSQAKMHEFSAEYSEAIAEFEKAISFDSQSARLRVEFARALLRTGDVNRAVQQCQTATELDPADSAPRFLLGQIYSNLSDEAEENVEKAISEFERTIELDPEHFEALYYLGDLQLERKNYQAAVTSLSQFLQLRPWVVRAYLLKSRAHRGLSDLEAAIETLERSREYDEASLEVVRELGQLYENAKEYEKANALYGEFLAVAEDSEIEFRQALVLSQQERLVEAVSVLRRLSDNAPDNLRLKVFLGEVLKRRKSYAEAAEIFRDVLKVEPNNFTANFRLGESLAQMGERQQAIERFLRLLEINGSDQDRILIQTSLAFVYQDAREFDKSAELFQTIIRENPEDDLTRLRLTYVFKESGQLEKALALSEELLSKCWDSSYEENSHKKHYLIARAQVLSAADQLEKASELLKDQRSHYPDPEELYLVGSQLHLEHKSYRRAQQMIETAISQYPDSEKLRFQLAAIHERQDEFEQAEILFRKMLEKNPEHAGVLNYLGYMLADRGVQLAEALGYIERALEIDPHNGAYLDSLGWVYFRLNELEKAELNLTQAARSNDADPTILDHLGDLYSRLGQYREAHEYYERSILFSTEEEEQKKVKKKLSDVNELLSKEPH